jgi:hypothetical protein
MQNDAADREILHAIDDFDLASLWQDTGGSD